MSISSKELLEQLTEIAESAFGAEGTLSSARRLLFALYLLKVLEEREINLPLCLETATGAAHAAALGRALPETIPSLLETNAKALGCSTLFPGAAESAALLQDRDTSALLKAISLLNAEIPLEDLAYLYEGFIVTEQNREGLFYTPLPLVAYITSGALKPLLDKSTPARLSELKILDPACGAGLFLLQAARELQAFANRHAFFPANDVLFRNSLYGVDRDLRACELTRVLLSCLALESKQLTLFPKSEVFFSLLSRMQANIRAGDSLLDDRGCLTGQAEQESLALPVESFSWRGAWPAIIESGGFHCIIGNPPYGLARDQQISRPENERLKVLYRDYLCGKVNKYMLFMVRGYQLLKEGGTLSYVVPNSWLGIRSALPLRRLFLSKRCLQSLAILEREAFEGLSVEAVVFRIDKGMSYRHIEVTPPQRAAGSRSFRLPYKACEASNDLIIPVGWSDAVRSVLRRLYHRTCRLDDPASPFTPLIALQAYALGKGTPPQTHESVANHVFHATEKLNENYHPYLEGSDIRRYALRPAASWLHHGAWLAEPQNLERFSGPRIMMREVLSPPPYLLNCAFSSELFLYNKSVLHILPKNSPGSGAPEFTLLWALLGILNSKLASFVVLQRGRKAQREIFPKLVNDDLKAFPLPAAFREKDGAVLKTLAALARQRCAAGEPENALDRKLDQEVYRLYNLTENHIAALEESLFSRVREPTAARTRAPAGVL